jgi:hypothetical protein
VGDAKVIDRITDIERGQMLNDLKITKLRVGVILNFKNQAGVGTNGFVIRVNSCPFVVKNL